MRSRSYLRLVKVLRNGCTRLVRRSLENSRSSSGVWTVIFLAVFCSCVPLLAQEPQYSSLAGPQPQASAQPDPGSTPDSNWHFAVSPYLWMSGIHGTVGVSGFDTSVHAGFGDIFSNLDIGLMAVSELRYKRFLLPVDLMWIKLSDDKALPIQVVAIKARTKATNFFIGPKVGYRFVETPRLTADAFAGFRYWHVGASLKFEPSLTGQTFSTGQTWADPLLGARFQTPLGRKLRFTLFGDVGGFGAGSQLEWQVMPVLGYQLNKRFTLQAAYRYLDVNYRSGGFKYDVAMDGLLLGATIRFK